MPKNAKKHSTNPKTYIKNAKKCEKNTANIPKHIKTAKKCEKTQQTCLTQDPQIEIGTVLHLISISSLGPCTLPQIIVLSYTRRMTLRMYDFKSIPRLWIGRENLNHFWHFKIIFWHF